MTTATGSGRCRARRRTSSCSPCARRCGQRRAQLLVEGVGGVAADLDRAAPERRSSRQGGQHVAHRGLDRGHDRAGAAVGVGAVEEEEVGEVGDGDAEVGARDVAPRLGERPARPSISSGATKSCDAKPVARTSTSVARSRPPGAMPRGVMPRSRSLTSSTSGRMSVGYQSSVSITRLQPSSSRGVSRRRSAGSEIARRICARHRLHAAEQPVVARHAVRAELVEGPDRGAVELLQRREALEGALGPLGVGEVHLRDRPARRALVDVDLGGRAGDRGHDLDRAAARPDHGDATAGEVDVMAPAGGVEGRAGEVVEPGQRGDARGEAGRRRRSARRRELPRAGLQRPAPVRKRAERTSVDVRTSSGRAISSR